MRNKIILPTVLVTSLFIAPVAMADCKSFWGCTLDVAGKTTKLVIKGATKPFSIAAGAVVHAANSYANGDSAGEIVLNGVGGAVKKTAESISDTFEDVIEVSDAVAGAAKKAVE